MSLKTKKIYQKRQFLNTDKSSSAYLIANIVKESFTNKKGETTLNLDANVDIADCYKKVSLDFNVTNLESKTQIKEKLRKVNLLRKLVNEFADNLEETLNGAMGK